MTPTLLAIFAHPDDEAFGTGGMLAYYARKGVKVALVCATKGEAGEISDQALATPDTLHQVREHELRCTASILGISELIFLDYCDSGMEGSDENLEPTAFINAPGEEVIARLVEIIRSLQPEIIVTFEPNGGYGHPDHIAIHQHTTAAFHAATDPHRYAGLGSPWQTRRLFYTAIPTSFFTTMRRRMVALGMDTTELDRFEKLGIGWPDTEVNTILDVSQVIDTKWDAVHCHQTQLNPDHLFKRLPEADMKSLMSREHFQLVWPEKTAIETPLKDLFEGL